MVMIMPVPTRSLRSSMFRVLATASGAAAITLVSIAARPVRLADGLTFHYTTTSSSPDKARREAMNVSAMVRITRARYGAG